MCHPWLTMTNYADLEIGLHYHSGADYAVDLRLSRDESGDDVLLTGSDAQLFAKFDEATLDDLRALSLDPAAYGELLGHQLFAEPALLKGLDQAFAVASNRGATLRV